MTVTRTETVDTGSGPMRIALALPEGDRPRQGWPGVLVVHELFGLRDEIRRVGDRFAERGWAAAMPDLFSTGNAPACAFRAMREVMGGRPGDVTAQVEDSRSWLAALPQVDGDVRTYPQAGHSFLTDGKHSPLLKAVTFPLRAGFVGDAAEPGWARIFAWLDTHVAA